MSDTPKEYIVKTIEQMAEIPAEARGRFLAELPFMLDQIAHFQSLTSAMGGQFLIGESPVWIDDDKSVANISISIVDKIGNKDEILTATMKIRV